MRDGLGGIDSIALVGGTSEIGLAIVRELSKLGVRRFVLAGRDPDRISSAATDLTVSDVVKVDLTRPDSISGAVDALFANGDLDVVVLSAGVLHSEPNGADVEEMALVNGAGSIAMLKHVSERLQSQGHGHLVVLSSIAVVRPRPSNYWYGASKVGLDFAALGLAGELDGSGVKVSIIRPGFVQTRMTAGLKSAPFSSSTKEVASAVAASVRSEIGGVVWVPGILKWVSLMLRLLPRRLLERLDR